MMGLLLIQCSGRLRGGGINRWCTFVPACKPAHGLCGGRALRLDDMHEVPHHPFIKDNVRLSIGAIVCDPIVNAPCVVLTVLLHSVQGIVSTLWIRMPAIHKRATVALCAGQRGDVDERDSLERCL